MDVPEVRYARTPDGLNLAYQVFGDGPPILVVPPILSNMELSWEHELYRRVLERMARRARVVQFDKRGIGNSDRSEGTPTLDQRVQDVEVVLETVGLERVGLLGLSEGGLMSQYFAARQPDRVDRLCLINTFAALQGMRELLEFADGPVITRRQMQDTWREVIESWGTDAEPMVRWFMPSQLENAVFVRWFARLQRLTASRSDFRRQWDSLAELDARDEVERIVSPTLVVHSRGDRIVDVTWGRWLADHIPGAEYHEVDGIDHFLWISPNWSETLDVILDFLVGTAPAVRSERRFAVVLFTDIVGSTKGAAAVGDVKWRNLLDSHDRTIGRTSDRYGGRIVKSTGDGALVMFDAPSAGVACARALREELAALGITIRAGLHAGEVEVRDEGDVAGLTVHIAARVEQAASDGALFVSQAVRDMLLGTEFTFADAGSHELKGVDGDWHLYALS